MFAWVGSCGTLLHHRACITVHDMTWNDPNLQRHNIQFDSNCMIKRNSQKHKPIPPALPAFGSIRLCCRSMFFFSVGFLSQPKTSPSRPSRTPTPPGACQSEFVASQFAFLFQIIAFVAKRGVVEINKPKLLPKVVVFVFCLWCFSQVLSHSQSSKNAWKGMDAYACLFGNVCACPSSNR